MSSIEWGEDEYSLDKECMESIKLMEKIRQANSDLRDFGNEQYKKAEEYEKDSDYYRNQVEKLEREVELLQSEVKELEKEISQA